MPLTPGPGLTLVVRRNGSGKSSFAEAAEMLLTGANRRWQGRPRHWLDGWRNLHHSDACLITGELSIDGEPGPVRLLRRWTSDDALEHARTIVRAPQCTDRPIEALGWDHALVAYRPFLSYNELGSMLEGRPSGLHPRRPGAQRVRRRRRPLRQRQGAPQLCALVTDHADVRQP